MMPAADPAALRGPHVEREQGMRRGWVRAAALALLLAAPGIAHAEWLKATSKHFVVYSRQNETELQEYTARLEKYDKAVRFVRGMEDPPVSAANRLTVYVLRTQEEVAEMAGAPGSGIAGFYNPRASGALAFVHSEMPRTSSGENKWQLTPEVVFFHEYLHHLMLQDLNLVYPPWMVEGYAEFFATAQFEKDGSVGFGAFPRHRAAGLSSLDDLSLEDMLGASYKRLDSAEIELLYGRGWLLTHYLATEPSRRGQITRYVEGIQRGQAPIEAARAAFGDLKKLNRDLGKHLSQKTFSYIVVPATALQIDAITVQPVTPGEAAIMKLHYTSQRGVDDREAADLVVKARKIAADYPGDAFVQTALAEAELDARYYDNAIAAADRALAVRVDDRNALLLKARAMMEKGKREPAKTNWNAIRALIMKANRADPEDAQPLMAFYETFSASGTAPTRNAVEGLLYALERSPQDRNLRVLAVRQLLVDKKLAEAKVALGPIANDPQGGEGRERAQKAITAIDAGDAAAALKALTPDDKDKDKKKGR
jgi:hypothetical protein